MPGTLRNCNTHLSPPLLPADTVYTTYYCEENIYLLCQSFLHDPTVANNWEAFVVFISNHTKSVVLFNQMASREVNTPIIWDYHVILILRRRADQAFQSQAEVWVYDVDTRLPIPCPLEDYICDTFYFQASPEHQSLFRVIPGELFMDCFASDRSHMLTTNEWGIATYQSPPPPYPAICGRLSAARGVFNNLMSNFVCMSQTEETYGDVLDLNGLVHYF